MRDKKSASPSPKKSKLFALREEREISRFLMPDAPERKQKRKGSPSRVACPLKPGVPEVPPPPILQPWQKPPKTNATKRNSAVSPRRPSRFELPDSPQPGPSSINDLIFPIEPMDGLAVVDVVREVTPPRKLPKLLSSPSTGIERVNEINEIEENNIVQGVQIELIGFSPQTHIFDTIEQLDEDTERQILEWESHVSQLSGSDLDEDDVAYAPSDRHIDTGLNNLSPEMMRALDDMDARDDSALRELCNETQDPDILHFEWTNDQETFTGKRETFTGNTGPTFPTDGMSPLEVFEKIWDVQIIYLIVIETNKYAFQSNARNWTDVTAADIWLFFGISMLQSIIQVPVEREYWYPCMQYLKLGNFAELMPYKRFLQIKKYLHFVDNTILPQTTMESKKLYKISPIIQHLNNKFGSLYLPEQNIAIDESLLLWKGRLSFAQLIATKAAKVGIKSYELCESRTGYLWKMTIYTGKGDEHANVDANVDEPEGATSRIVYGLVRPLLNKGHTLVMDNFYNSPLLSRTLKRQQTDTMGTLRLNRQFVPASLRSKTKSNMRKGEVAFSQTNDLTIAVWHDMSVVAMISTFHKTEVGIKEKFGCHKYKPEVVLDYNLCMGGVDKKDQLLQAFPIERIRNPIWYKKLFRRLLNVSIHNAFVIHNHNKNKAQRSFRVLLAREILRKYSPHEALVAAPAMKAGHYPMKNESARARCKWCSKQKINTRTVWKCDTCHIALCIIGCFRAYHESSSQS